MIIVMGTEKKECRIAGESKGHSWMCRENKRLKESKVSKSNAR